MLAISAPIVGVQAAVVEQRDSGLPRVRRKRVNISNRYRAKGGAEDWSVRGYRGLGLSDSCAPRPRGFMEIFALFCSVWEFRLKLFAVVFGSETSTPTEPTWVRWVDLPE